MMKPPRFANERHQETWVIMHDFKEFYYLNKVGFYHVRGDFAYWNIILGRLDSMIANAKLIVQEREMFK